MSIQETPIDLRPAGAAFVELLPGLGLVLLIASLATALHALSWLHALSPLILAITLGMIFHNVIGTPAAARAGVKFALRRILRAAIILLGLQLTLTQVASVGWGGLVATITTLGATFFFTLWMGHRLGVSRPLTALVAAGTSICGASAVIASNAVIRGEDEDVAYAIACVTIFGSLSMLLYPPIGAALAMSPHAFGLWTGATIHEVAQVVAAAFQGGEAAGHFGAIVKLTRVMMLAPVVLALAMFWKASVSAAKEEGDAVSRWSHVPWFAFGFMAMVGFNTVMPLQEGLRLEAGEVTTFLLAVSLAAMGLETDFRKLKAMGLRPLLLGASSWAFISLLGFTLVAWLT
ncbi:MAG: putative sulfate exporter family transporter [Rhizobiales bacterium]|nr:putative sulfate exporter family transporter [Hyphomicrobiales bacterium]